jgi:hypothetical protein
MAAFPGHGSPLRPTWGPSRPLEQQSGRPAHAAFMDRLVEGGFIILGGPLVDEQRVVRAVEAKCSR